MSSEPPPPGPGQPPDDDPFKKQPPPAEGGGSPYDPPPPGGQTPPYGSQPPPFEGQPPPSGGGGPYGGGGDPYGGGGPYGGDPLAGMPPLAESGKRVLARILDMILVLIVVWLLSWAFGVTEYNVDSDKIEYGKSFGQSLVAAVCFVAYDTVMISKSGQTLGKRLFNHRVANLDNGSTPSVQTSLVRALVLWIPFAFCCACIWTAIAGGWSFFDKPYKQGLHDKAAKTVVVDSRA
ncbi:MULTISPECIES: RDD family protein [unclassified Streptomyces]|uniref:RDD family protein n=1 Tax=unclassified Streptomyces TaxID=2593676 RepID=UPI00224FAFC3|nr:MULTISPECIES: RDD family protein [unclassified Streptomyces]MCX4990622.1 RDD family protein [Streptomyces sp. NBC_00568]MCX5004147.1 RDD family protein [Streptomyces sp. NBC_00638]